MKTVDLCPGGGDMPLTQENKHEFVRLYTKYILEDSISTQFEAFRCADCRLHARSTHTHTHTHTHKHQRTHIHTRARTHASIYIRARFLGSGFDVKSSASLLVLSNFFCLFLSFSSCPFSLFIPDRSHLVSHARKGFSLVVGGSEVIRTFVGPKELELMLIGTQDLDLLQLRDHAVYDGYSADSPVIQWYSINQQTDTDFYNIRCYIYIERERGGGHTYTCLYLLSQTHQFIQSLSKLTVC